MTTAEVQPTVLVLAPMPPFPTSSGSRRRLLATCEMLQHAGFAVDFAYLQHEDQVYTRFGQHPPTDSERIVAHFQRNFLIPTTTQIPLKTRGRFFDIDAWCPVEALDFVNWYFKMYPNTRAVIVNYVFLSRCLEIVPDGVLRIIDTHDRFADRQLQYQAFRAEPNFFYTDQKGESRALNRADIILAIQSSEANYFRSVTRKDVLLLPPIFPVRHPFEAPVLLSAIGFIGHGNDPNLFSIGKFAYEWSHSWRSGMPTLLIAGEICGSLGDIAHAEGIKLIGYVDDIEEFYDAVDIVIAPMLSGTGLKMKVAEALSMGVPVIGTQIGFEGFDIRVEAHRLDGITDTIKTVIALQHDKTGLEALTAACRDLLDRYNARAEDCKSAFIGRIPHGGRRDTDVEGGASEVSIVARVGNAIVTREHSLRSLITADRELGVLIATEAPDPASVPRHAYDHLRYRWFARPMTSKDILSDTTVSPFSGVPLVLSPEWIHVRALPTEVRESLVGPISQAHSDWTAEAVLLGERENCIQIVAMVPSFLLDRSRAIAAFVVDVAGNTRELDFKDIVALCRSPKLTFSECRHGDLRPIPAVLNFVPATAGSFSRNFGKPARLIFLIDASIGTFMVNKPVQARWAQ